MKEKSIIKCETCQEERDINLFYPYNKKMCKICNREKNKKWRKNNPEKVREQRKQQIKNNPYHFYFKKIKIDHGITKEEYWTLFYNQNKCCSICKNRGREGKESGRKYLFVDHDHITGRIRGLLCHHCNSAIGFARDNTDTLKNAIIYLEKNNVYIPNYII